MKLIADGGSTKTDWAVAEEGMVMQRIVTQGINPFHQDERLIARILSEELISQLAFPIDSISFYGAGCTPEMSPKLQGVLRRMFPHAGEIGAFGDLLAAARAVWGHKTGIVCILGTGANSGLYDGREIVMNTPPLGYILGDEGSGAALGKSFLNAIFKGFLPAEMRDDYLDWAGLTYADIISKVYRQPLANRFLASAARYIVLHLDNRALRELVKANFRQFFRRNIVQYHRCSPTVSLGAVGSIAWHFRELFSETAREEGYKPAKVIKSPIEGLVRFHAEL